MNLISRLPAAVLSAIAVLAFAPAASAGIVVNSSFEGPVATSTHSPQFCYLNNPGAIKCDMTTFSLSNFGWTGNAPVIRANSTAWGRPGALTGYEFGDQLVGLQATSSLQQTLDLIAGTYELSWNDAGRRSYANAFYDVQFNGVVLDSFTTAAGQAWSEQRLSFFAAGDGTLRFKGMTAADGTAFIDNISLRLVAQAVPEPGTLALVAAALAGVCVAMRRRQA